MKRASKRLGNRVAAAVVAVAITIDPFLEAFAAGFAQKADITVTQWADTYRWVSRKSSSSHGPWRTDRTPYLKGIMDALSPQDPAQRIVFEKGAQVGGTEVGKNFLGYVIHQDPGPVLMVFPGTKLARRVSRNRIAPMLQETPVLRELVKEAKSRDAGNTILEKDFDGGSLTLATSNSVPDLKSAAIRYLIFEEVDEYERDVDDQGDPITIAEERTTTFESRRKVFLNSTPKINPGSLIDREYKASDQRRYFVPCPRCGNMDWIRWENIVWENGDPKTAKLRCVACDGRFGEGQKMALLERGEWRATAESADGVTVGFHLSALYSPWRTWVQCVRQFLAAKQDPVKLKTFVQQVLGEPYEDRSERADQATLIHRREDYGAEVPHGVGILVSATDVHDNRLEFKVKGYGAGEQSWLISKQVFLGDTNKEEVWAELHNAIFRPYRHESGRDVRIYYSVVDAGFRAERAYRFTKPREGERVFAVHGGSEGSKKSGPIIQSVTERGMYRARLYTYNADEARGAVQARMRILEPGPGYMHFPKSVGGQTVAMCDEEYFKQLTAKAGVWREEPGKSPYREWINVYERDESFDLEVMCLVAVNIGGIALTQSLPVLAAALSAPLEDEAPEKGGGSGAARPGSGWMNSWRGR